MNIYAGRGTKVVFTGRGGYSHDKREAHRYLKVGQIYTVDHTDVGFSRTKVYLIEVPGRYFTSTMFGDAWTIYELAEPETKA